MIASELKYKKTGIHWMTEVPTHWEIVRLKWVLRTGEGIKIGPFGSSLKLEDLDDNGIRVYGQENVIKDDFSLGKRFLSKDKFEELSVYEVFPNDILVTMMGTTGKCKLVPENAEKGIMDSHLIRLRANEKIRPAFLSVLINDSIQLKFQMSTDSKGSIMSGLNSKIVKNLFLPLPPIEEQDIILENLSIESSKITHFIQTKQRFIELLKEQRQSIITQAVTKGIDEGVKMKESVLGEIPEHWEVRRLKTLVEMKSGENITAESIYKTGEYPVYGGNGLRGFTKTFTNDGEFVLIGRQGALCGNINYAFGKFFASEHAVVVYPKVVLDYFWLGETLRMMNLNQYSMAAAQPGLAINNIRVLPVPFPQIEEQKRIIEHIKTETRTLDIAISKAEREIELIKEYREAVIAEAVMGKVKI